MPFVEPGVNSVSTNMRRPRCSDFVFPGGSTGGGPAARKIFQGVGREEPLVGALEFGDQRQLFLGGLDRILRMIVDRAERLIAQGSGAKVVHQRRIQRRRVDRPGDTAKQYDARRRRILRDPDVGRERTHDADGRVLGDPRSARDAVVETIVEEQRVIRIFVETLLHISRRERPVLRL